VLRFKLQLRNIACLSLCHLERSERSRAQARKIAVRMGYSRLSGSLARSWGEGEGEGQLCGAVVCCVAHSVVSRESGRDVAAESRRQSQVASLHLNRAVFWPSLGRHFADTTPNLSAEPQRTATYAGRRFDRLRDLLTVYEWLLLYFGEAGRVFSLSFGDS
jgi:hypothetical protein